MTKCFKSNKGEIEKALKEQPKEYEPKRRPDSWWSWLVCAAFAMSVVIVVGITYSFGLLLPPLMETFDETRQATGNARNTQNVVKLRVKTGQFLSQTRSFRLWIINRDYNK